MPSALPGTSPSLVLINGKILCETGSCEALAVSGNRIAALGRSAEIAALAAPETEVIDLGGRTVVAGLVDGHAHLDREGLKSVLPSLADCRSVEDIVQRIAEIARQKKPGEWIITMPIGIPPSYEDVLAGIAEGRFPDRRDLDRAAPDNPVYIRSIWGYWRSTLPLVSIANSQALRLAGIDASTTAPAPSIEICRDADGEPNGIFVETNKMPVVELSLMRRAPHFSASERAGALAASMRLYNRAGTTSVFEGHGIAAEVLDAYRQVRSAGRQSVRTAMIFSPAWPSTSAEDCRLLLKSWGHWLASRGLGDAWLGMAGLYGEIDDSVERGLRSAAFPQTGWAGFHYNSSLPRDALKEVLVEAARNGIRAVGILPNMLDLFAEVDRVAPIAGQRWILGHVVSLTPDQVKQVAGLGLAVTTHLTAYIYKRGSELVEKLGRERAGEIVPLRSLREAGVPISFGSDNAPLSLFQSISLAVNRRDRMGAVIAPEQALTREEALECATLGGAKLTFEDDEKGSIGVGKLADLAVLTGDPLSCAPGELARLESVLTIVDGRIVYRT
ncbi:Exoenzymes regulatory protein AepA [Hyphomicrobiales bacterium]|nr:Exoenzymes regulatory protein AepA [Hyphomicrobiales bacterium]CAH1697827.1 Exoenzymes regulatory protein AepA [Hyphomicrobiales bacterium]CAI0347473.1 Exoenzymes regulatory protein AepA [Hyphomicrobiales bacterium]